MYYVLTIEKVKHRFTLVLVIYIQDFNKPLIKLDITKI